MLKTLVPTIVLCVLIGAPTYADIIGVSGSVVYDPTIPGDLSLDAYESDENIFVFDEQQNFTLTNDLAVDIAAVGTYNQASDLTGNGGTIGAGTAVNSYLIHVDPVSTPSSLVSYAGSITFSNPILGVIVGTSGLISTDSILGVGTTTYSTDSLRGLEWTNQDEVQLSVSPDGMTMSLKAKEIIDNIRVVEAVPVPGAALLGLLGLSAAGLKLRRRSA